MSSLALHLISHRFSPFNYCLSVDLSLDNGDYPQNSHVVFCRNKLRSFEPFMRQGNRSETHPTFNGVDYSFRDVTVCIVSCFSVQALFAVVLTSNVHQMNC